MSDYVHPDASSHYYFFQDFGDKIHFIYRKKPREQDIGAILNNGCLTLDIYTVIWSRLEKVKLPNKFS